MSPKGNSEGERNETALFACIQLESIALYKNAVTIPHKCMFDELLMMTLLSVISVELLLMLCLFSSLLVHQVEDVLCLTAHDFIISFNRT